MAALALLPNCTCASRGSLSHSHRLQQVACAGCMCDTSANECCQPSAHNKPHLLQAAVRQLQDCTTTLPIGLPAAAGGIGKGVRLSAQQALQLGPACVRLLGDRKMAVLPSGAGRCGGWGGPPRACNGPG